MSNQPIDYDEMYRKSQENKFGSSRPRETNVDGDSHMILKKGVYDGDGARRETVHGEVYDPEGGTVKKRGLSPESFGFVSLILGVVAFIMVFVGMFLHFFMVLNIFICLTGIGFGIAGLVKKAATGPVGIIGIIINVFVLLVQLICLVIVAVGKGVSTVYNLFT